MWGVGREAETPGLLEDSSLCQIVPDTRGGGISRGGGAGWLLLPTLTSVSSDTKTLTKAGWARYRRSSRETSGPSEKREASHGRVGRGFEKWHLHAVWKDAEGTDRCRRQWGRPGADPVLAASAADAPVSCSRFLRPFRASGFYTRTGAHCESSSGSI